MRKNECKKMVVALTIAMMLTGCNQTANEELLRTEYGTGNVESEMVQNMEEDSYIENAATEVEAEAIIQDRSNF